MITITNGIRTIEFDDEKLRVVEADCYDFMDWIENAVYEKYRRTLDQIVAENTDRNPVKMTIDAKADIVKGIPLKSAKERAIENQDIWRRIM